MHNVAYVKKLGCKAKGKIMNIKSFLLLHSSLCNPLEYNADVEFKKLGRQLFILPQKTRGVKFPNAYIINS
ncbi:protein of unknown function [Legionella micdadei]|uniref:Uncharacterized protein n=1 Tax=Legionella micdadei TaxID=451 RepID=A0A098GDB6_LEGMI|nr:protein of unknown function [Legionella micdadei]